MIRNNSFDKPPSFDKFEGQYHKEDEIFNSFGNLNEAHAEEDPLHQFFVNQMNGVGPNSGQHDTFSFNQRNENLISS